MVLAPARDPPPLQQAPRRRADDRLRRRNPGIVDESGRLVACPGRASHRRAVAADARCSGPKRACPDQTRRKRGDGDGRHGQRRPDLDAALCAPTGLEEYVGRGVGMTLTIYARGGALVFRSKNYFLELFGRRLFLPAWLTPGTLYVTHAELPDGKFSFALQIFHPRFGLLRRQMAIFREIAS